MKGQDITGQERHDSAWQDRTRRGMTGQGRAGQGMTGQGRAGQDKTRQDKVRQDRGAVNHSDTHETKISLIYSVISLKF